MSDYIESILCLIVGFIFGNYRPFCREVEKFTQFNMVPTRDYAKYLLVRVAELIFYLLFILNLALIALTLVAGNKP
jgi:hypothetical protein